MPGGGSYRFQFNGQPPLVFRMVFALLFVNTIAELTLETVLRFLKPGGFLSFPPCRELAKNGVQYHVPAVICWFESAGFIWIQFILLAIGAALMILYRKSVVRTR
jgi:hypothetical protein